MEFQRSKIEIYLFCNPGILSHQTEKGQSMLAALNLCHLIVMLDHRVMMAEAQIVCLHSSNICVPGSMAH